MGSKNTKFLSGLVNGYVMAGDVKCNKGVVDYLFDKELKIILILDLNQDDDIKMLKNDM